MYRAETALQTAIAQLESAQLAEILQGNNGWTVVSAEIEWSASKLKDIVNVPFENNKFEGNGVTVRNGNNGSVLFASEGGAAIVYTASEDGTYTFNGLCSGKRGAGRWYTKTGEAEVYTEANGWIGNDSTFNRTFTLRAGESIAVHFEGAIDMSLTLSVTAA